MFLTAQFSILETNTAIKPLGNIKTSDQCKYDTEWHKAYNRALSNSKTKDFY